MTFALTKNDLALLKGVHPDLVKVIKRAAVITTIPFKITEGLRSVAQQEKNIAKGVSWTMNSRHLTGHAVDLIPIEDTNRDGKVTSAEQYAWPTYYRLAPIIKQAAKDVGVPVEWGGDWKKNKDGPHWQLPWKQYPLGKQPKAIAAIVADHPPATQKTEQQAAKQTAVLTGAGGATTGVGIGGPQIAQTALDAATGQQAELSSGDVARLIVAVIIIAASVGLAIYMWRKAHQA